jgi:hypothetical protein
VGAPACPAWRAREVRQLEFDLSALSAMTFLVNDLKRPFTAAGFANKIREWCNQAGLRHCTAHGLRKAGPTIAAKPPLLVQDVLPASRVLHSSNFMGAAAREGATIS